jgi:hypothetical protein
MQRVSHAEIAARRELAKELNVPVYFNLWSELIGPDIVFYSPTLGYHVRQSWVPGDRCFSIFEHSGIPGMLYLAAPVIGVLRAIFEEEKVLIPEQQISARGGDNLTPYFNERLLELIDKLITKDNLTQAYQMKERMKEWKFEKAMDAVKNSGIQGEYNG